jgi:hypothetical protein
VPVGRLARPGLEAADEARVLDRVATEATLAKLAEGARATYQAGWRSWLLWRQLRDNSPHLQGETREERLADEDDLIRYVVFLYDAPSVISCLPCVGRVWGRHRGPSASVDHDGGLTTLGWQSEAEAARNPADADVA